MSATTAPSKVRGAPSKKRYRSNRFQHGWARMPRTSPAMVVGIDEFQGQLNSILTQFSTVISGRVQLIDINSILDKLQSKYSVKSRDHVDDIVKNSIERRLSPYDVYTRYSNSSYVIVFAQLAEKEAQMKGLLIAEEISTRLIGKQENAHLVEVKTATVKEDGKLLFEKVPAIESLLQEFDKGPNIDNTVDALGQEAQGQDEVFFIFRPMWLVGKEKVSTLHVVPDVPVAEKS